MAASPLEIDPTFAPVLDFPQPADHYSQPSINYSLSAGCYPRLSADYPNPSVYDPQSVDYSLLSGCSLASDYQGLLL
jgi:hypothetical protein